MVKEELENLREQINLMIVSENINFNDLLIASRKLDVLIVKFMSKQKMMKSK